VLDAPQLELEVECQDSITALPSAEPGRPMSWVMSSRSHGGSEHRAEYSLTCSV